MVDGQIVYRTTPDDFVRYVEPLIQSGASFIGGCCGTSPEFIQSCPGRKWINSDKVVKNHKACEFLNRVYFE